MAAQSTDTILRIAELRNKSRAGTITLEELKEGIEILRQNRVDYAAVTKSLSTKGKPNADDLLKELEGLD